MSEYLIPINYNKKDKYTKEYFNNNFYEDAGVIRRIRGNNENNDGYNVSPKERRIELYRVLHHFLDKKHIRNDELKGIKKVSYAFDEDTFCICGQRSHLFKCVHLESDIKFYMGSSCITLFETTFEPEKNNGLF